MRAWQRWASSSTKLNYRAINSSLLSCTSALQVEKLVLQADKFDAINCATAFRTLARLRSRDKMVMDKLLKLCHSNRLSGQALSIACHSIANARLLGKIPSELVSQLEEFDFAMFDAQAVGNILWAFGKLNHRSTFVLTSFAESICIQDRLPTFQAQNLINAIWAFATLKFSHPKAQAQLSLEIQSRSLADFTPLNLSNCIWAFASLQDPSICDKFLVELNTNRNLQDFSPQSVANICWAYSTLNVTGEQTTEFFRRVSEMDLTRFLPTDLAMILWSSLQIKPPDSFPSPVANAVFVEITTRRDLTGFSSQDLTKLIHAFSSLRVVKGDYDLVCQLVAEECMKREWKTFNVLDLSNLVLALVQFDYRHTKLLHRMATETDFTKFTPLALSNTLRAFATFDFKHCDQLCQAISSQSELTEEFSPQAIALLFWGCAKLEFNQLELCNKLQGADFRAYALQDLVMMVWAMAVLDWGRDWCDLASRLALELGSRKSLPLQSLSTVLWSFACMDLLHLPEVEQLFQRGEMAPVRMIDQPTLKDAQQLLHTKLAWEQTYPATRSMVLDRACAGSSNKEWMQQLIVQDQQNLEGKRSSHVQEAIARILSKSFRGDFKMETTVLGGRSFSGHVDSFPKSGR
ncbi:hypothetical protein BASA81_004136 [Batrachochytrium salamandrivorans]|nr:hypothetical protein BASA81_004136 [Batrachochytrium salamandrivorans]